MIHVLGIGGEPATGKSTLMHRVLEQLGPSEPFTFRTALGSPSGKDREWNLGTVHHEVGVIVLGHYLDASRDRIAYPGTDRLSMAVQPIAIAAIESLHTQSTAWAHGYSVLFEGDRLFNRSFIEAVEKIVGGSRANWFLLMASKAQKEIRRERRKDTKSAKFLASRVTKYERLRDWLAERVQVEHRSEVAPGGTWLYCHDQEPQTTSIALMVETLVGAHHRRCAKELERAEGGPL